MRDSKDPVAPPLLFSAEEWETFRDAVKSGEYDDF